MALLVGMWPLWYVTLYGGHLARPDHCVAKLFSPLFPSGARALQFSWLVAPQMCNPAALHRTRPRSHTLCSHAPILPLPKNVGSARLLFIHCSAWPCFGGRLLARRSAWVSQLVCVWQSGRSPLWGARTAVAPVPYTHLYRLCALDRIYKNRIRAVWDRLWPGPKTTVQGGSSTASLLAIVHFGSVGRLCGLFERSKAT